MSDEAKLGLIAGVLAVVGVAAFGLPKEPAKPDTGTPQATTNLPPLPPAAVNANR